MTTDSPYSTTCGANTSSIPLVAPTICERTQWLLALDGFSSPAIGPAAATMMIMTGTRMRTAQVSTADEIFETRSLAAASAPARWAERASTGTMALVSAPASTSSDSRLGTWYAVTYTVPRQPEPTVWENSSVRIS